ncbi:energy transducer TonB [Chryseobacterium sp.]|uniref:energy transducer TonB n=1 Tax=Chryseobacterium sp. TaxID=1871047 RepID=UPI002FC67EE7
MKKLFVFIVLISSVKTFSQESITPKEEITTKEYAFDKADKPAEYPGGINSFRQKFTQVFDSSKINTKGLIKSEAQFVITEEGKVIEIKIIGDDDLMNKEMERSIKAMSKTKWKPALLNGQPVKYLFRLPIAMNFHN